MSRVVMTGASGFIGSHALRPLLEAGHEVHALSRASEPDLIESELRGEIAWHAVDLLDHDRSDAAIAAIAPEQLLHLAWYAEHGKFWTAAQNLDWVAATLRLLERFAQAGGRRAVLAGSCAEYDWTSARECYEEDSSPLAPATLYGTAKHATQLVASAFATVQDGQLEVAWGRVFMLFGPGEAPTRIVPAVIRALLAGEDAAVSDGKQVRDFLYVADVARAFAAILDSRAVGAINVASGEGRTVGEVVSTIAEIIGRPELVRWGAVPQRAGDPAALVADVKRLHDEVGFRPATELGDGLEQTVAWWRSKAR